MAPKKDAAKKPSIKAAEPAEPPPPSVPQSGTGKFYYPTGATYEGDWIIAPEKPPALGEPAAVAAALLPAGKEKTPAKKASTDKLAAGAGANPENAAPEAAPEKPKPNRQRHGKGLYVDGGYHYEGDWQNDKMHGQGCFKYASGASYEGQWDNDVYMGIGMYKWPNGASYSGGWRDNKMHGDGTYIDKVGNAWAGQFFNGTGPGLICEIK